MNEPAFTLPDALDVDALARDLTEVAESPVDPDELCRELTLPLALYTWRKTNPDLSPAQERRYWCDLKSRLEAAAQTYEKILSSDGAPNVALVTRLAMQNMDDYRGTETLAAITKLVRTLRHHAQLIKLVLKQLEWENDAFGRRKGGRPQEKLVHPLIDSLADVYKRYAGREPGVSNWETKDGEYRVGPFLRFVGAICTALEPDKTTPAPETVKKVLAEWRKKRETWGRFLDTLPGAAIMLVTDEEKG